MNRFIVTAFAFCVLVSPPIAAAQGVVFVVRHAERADTSADSVLSTHGHARAARLSEILKTVGVTQIYTSNLRRTIETAAPLAKALQLTSNALIGNDFDTLVTRLRAMSRHDRVLVVGHSNTVPEILRRLGVTAAVSIADAEYDNLFIVIPQEGSATLFLPMKY